MRPDEHKKRKSSQYQNKKKNTASDKQDGKLPIKKPVDEKLKRADSDEKKDATESPHTAKFSRRKLTSNWEKYEIKTEEDPHLGITQKGESFEKLLKSAGASNSQFRFKDETFWEDDVSDLPTNWITIDLKGLADSLDSLTLCQKLNLSKEHFTNDQIKFMRVETKEYSKSVSGSSQVNISQGEDAEDANSLISSNAEGNQPNKSLKGGTISLEKSLDGVGASHSDFSHSCINDYHLDTLLSVDTVEISQNLKHSETADDTADDLEDWLDSVLD